MLGNLNNYIYLTVAPKDTIIVIIQKTSENTFLVALPTENCHVTAVTDAPKMP